MSMNRNRFVAAAAMAAALTGGLAARAQQGGVAGRVGEALDNTGRAIKNGVQGAYAKTQMRINTMEVLDRVYSRLHWERTLTTSALDLEVQPGGMTTLRGAVPNARAKAKAVELARDTVGVTRVVDQLTVAAPTATPPAAPVIEAPGAVRVIP